MPADPLHDIADQATLEQALNSDRAVLYKHSTRCPVSDWAIDEILQFAGTRPEWPVYVLKVIEHRDLSDAVVEHFGVQHQSPQVFVINNGQCLWHASHSDITEQELFRETA